MPQSARLSAGGGGNRNLGKAQIEVALFLWGLPLVEEEAEGQSSAIPADIESTSLCHLTEITDDP